MKKLKTEESLLSCAGTVKYLSDLLYLLDNRPMLPQHMLQAMPGTVTQVNGIRAQVQQAISSAQAEAKPFVVELLKEMGVRIGGAFKFTVEEPRWPCTLEVSGFLADADVALGYFGGTRRLRVFLEDVCITNLTSGQTYDRLEEGPHGIWKNLGRGVIRHVDPAKEKADVGRKPGVRITVPIKAKDRIPRIYADTRITYS